MTVDEYKQMALRDRMIYDFFVDLKRDLRRIADSLERLVEMDER